MEKILLDLYGPSVSKSVIDELAYPERIFNNAALPSCFNCEECELTNHCKHFDVLKVFKKLQDKYKQADIDSLYYNHCFEINDYNPGKSNLKTITLLFATKMQEQKGNFCNFKNLIP